MDAPVGVPAKLRQFLQNACTAPHLHWQAPYRRRQHSLGISAESRSRLLLLMPILGSADYWRMYVLWPCRNCKTATGTATTAAAAPISAATSDTSMP